MTATATSLKALRSTLTDTQRAILDDVWLHVKTSHIGLPERPLLDKYGRPTLLSEVRKLGGTVIFSGHEENKIRYNVGLVGIFLTSDGPRLEDLTKRYLLVLRELYKKDKDIERFSSKDLAKWAPDFTANELKELKEILYRTHGSFASRLGGWNAEEWFVSVDDEVVELKSIEDWNGYVDSQVMKWHDPRQPAGEAERSSYQLSDSKRDPLFDAFREINALTLSGRTPSEKQQLDLSFMTDDQELRLILDKDWKESCELLQVEAWKSCVLLCGGIVEGLLLWQLENTQRRASAKTDDASKDVRYDGETLSGLLRQSKELGLLAEEEVFLMEWARLYRNTIHPGNHRRESRTVNRSHASLAQMVVQVVAAGVRGKASQ